MSALQSGPKHAWAQPQSHISPLLAICDLQSWRLLHLLSKQSVLYSLSSKACCTHFQTGCTLQQFASPSYFCFARYFRSDSEKFFQSLTFFLMSKSFLAHLRPDFQTCHPQGQSGNFAYRATETRNVNYRANETRNVNYRAKETQMRNRATTKVNQALQGEGVLH